MLEASACTPANDPPARWPRPRKPCSMAAFRRHPRVARVGPELVNFRCVRAYPSRARALRAQLWQLPACRLPHSGETAIGQHVTATTDIVPDSERRGLIGALPPRLRPYASLMRLDRPIGSWLLFWPCAWSVALAGVGGRWDLFLWLALGAFAMRSAGCVYNDIVDRDLDRQVERTRLRPLASGRVSLRGGLAADRALVPDRPRRPAPAQPGRGARRAGQPRAGRRLSVHEADHLVAAGVARPGLLLGRAGRLAGGHRQRSAWTPFLLWSEASPG